MIELSGELADGAHPYLVLPEHTRRTRAVLGDEPWIVTEQAVAIGGSAEEQLHRGHTHLNTYSRMDNYRKSWLRQGFDETDFEGGGSERLVRALVGMGSADDAAASVTAHLDAGADHVVVQVAVDSPTDDPLPDLRALAAALRL
ncbi:F420-dependent oxidoreductase [Williamsia soli]|uniref:F420-dependent oxidoreductase n=1 Tax=Williamsia soli TaxID=364929 RepID=UPI001F481FD4|nr:F420-dependent oxidoreductase [Williamsia soli]